MNADELQAALTRERLVRENLAARYGALVADNLELQLRIHELEHPGETAVAVHAEANGDLIEATP